MIILSIDVGVVNMGLCLFDSDRCEIIRATSVGLVEKRSEIKSDIEYIQRIRYLFQHSECGKQYFDPAEVVIIERQMKREMIIIQHIIATISEVIGKRHVEFITPLSVKRWFRKFVNVHDEKKRVKSGRRGVNHKLNKKESIYAFSVLFPEYNTSDTKKKDDIADASLQAMYWSLKNNSNGNDKHKKKNNTPKKGTMTITI